MILIYLIPAAVFMLNIIIAYQKENVPALLGWFTSLILLLTLIITNLIK